MGLSWPPAGVGALSSRARPPVVGVGGERCRRAGGELLGGLRFDQAEVAPL